MKYLSLTNFLRILTPIGCSSSDFKSWTATCRDACMDKILRDLFCGIGVFWVNEFSTWAAAKLWGIPYLVHNRDSGWDILSVHGLLMTLGYNIDLFTIWSTICNILTLNLLSLPSIGFFLPTHHLYLLRSASTSSFLSNPLPSLFLLLPVTTNTLPSLCITPPKGISLSH